jgi:hypothetical protein
MSNFAAHSISSHHKLEARSCCAIGEVQSHASLFVSGRVDHLSFPSDLGWGDGGQQGILDLPSVELRGITTLSPRSDFVAGVTPYPGLCRITKSTVLSHQVEASGLPTGPLTTAGVEIEAAAARNFLSRTALVEDVVVEAIPL